MRADFYKHHEVSFMLQLSKVDFIAICHRALSTLFLKKTRAKDLMYAKNSQNLRIHPVEREGDSLKLTGHLMRRIKHVYMCLFIYLLALPFSGRDTATALANYCGPVRARPQHQDFRTLFFTNSVWVL